MEQFSPGVLKYGIKHVVWHKAFDIKLLKLPALFTFTIHAGLRVPGSNKFRNSSYKEKAAGRFGRLFPDYHYVSYDYGFAYSTWTVLENPTVFSIPVCRFYIT